MLTGQSSHSSGMLGLAHRGWKFSHPERHIVHTLRANGYRTALAGLQHVAIDARTIGYDEVLPHTSDHVPDVCPNAVAFLFRAASQDKPFFLDVGFFETHREFPKPTDDPAFIQPPYPLPDTPETRQDMAGYHASVRLFDDGVGQLLRALDQAGLAENTLVIVTTDHGIAFPTMKAGLYDGGTGVGMIMRGPGVFSSPQAIDALLSQIDLFPTLCDYIRVNKPTWLEGKSMLPVISKGSPGIRDAVFSELNFHSAYEPVRAVRTARYKYIRRFDKRKYPVVTNCDDGLTKRLWVRNGWQTLPLCADKHGEELYDLMFDPAERNNIASRADMKAEMQSMRQRLGDWMRETDDPLLRGPILVPKGVRTDDPNAVNSTAVKAY